MGTRRPPLVLLALIAAVLLGATACGGGPDQVRWRDVRLSPPVGWTVFEQDDAVLSLANAPLDGEGRRGAQAVAAQFTHEPTTVPDDWRAFVEEQGGELEVDEAIEVDEVPATRLVFTFDANGIPTREMVVVVASRGIVMLFQPVLEQGETDGPDRFLANRATFDAILDGIAFGAPIRP